jgi:hypothetical protein
MSVTVNAQWQSVRCGKRVKCQAAVAQPCPTTTHHVSNHSANNCQRRVVIRTAVSSSCSAALACRPVGPIPYVAGNKNSYISPLITVAQPACPCQSARMAGIFTGPAIADPGTNSPFSLSGQQGPDTGNALLKPCERMFLACCAGGMPACHSQYLSCAIALGEVVRHAACP